ncbi:acyltransferase [Mangrovimonas xylaniphaga]|uniref:acyltransferase n=1 Tax=Mangrovimonas xylaniphaga TaxID=1645915 RepID=UPI0006B5F0CB|nr:acyltransferase [Mangrovimonas xylaniphaga]
MKRLFGAIINYIFNEVVTHVPCHALRKLYLRAFNKNIHKSSVILMHSKIPNFWNLEIGSNSIINQYCHIDCRHYRVIIKTNVDIGPFSRIWTLGHNPNNELHALYGGDVLIEDHVWIASGVTILPSVKLLRGAVVGASSVVHKSVGEKEIVAGNPARHIKMRDNNLNYNINYKPLLD